MRTPFLQVVVRLVAWLLLLQLGFCVYAATPTSTADQVISLDGDWRFQVDPENQGLTNRWFASGRARSGWEEVQVPHTWQVEPGSEDYVGIGWYARSVAPAPGSAGHEVRLEFDAVYRDARVWINGVALGEHTGSGWTPFGWPVGKLWKADGTNEIVVRVDNRSSEHALPYLSSLDWAIDGGIIRSVRLRRLPAMHLGHIQAHAEPAADFASAAIEAGIEVGSSTTPGQRLRVEGLVFDPGGNLVCRSTAPVVTPRGETARVHWQGTVPRPELWHFDRPRLYRLHFRLLRGDTLVHERDVPIGIRRVEVRPGRFLLNGEPMRLMGVEWMPGSDPRYGMAESPEHMRAVLRDLKRLNCLLTRFHWQQDDAVFDFCDREGILVQEEIPAWGGDTLKGRLDEVQAQQTREMIQAHANHPSIFAWGLCNEIGGQRAAAHALVRRGRELARAFDPHRLLTYASNSLRDTPERDASALLDFVEWNEYYESWYHGGTADVAANLERIRHAFPEQGLVISEYGLCECNPKNPSGDARRVEILRTHTDCYRLAPQVAGAIFFDYNDYRTLVGDKGQGSFRQRVHGVVDLFGRRKPSWAALRRECSPVRSLAVSEPIAAGDTTRATVEIVTRSLENDLPAYTLRDYLLVWVAYNDLGQPLGTGKRILADLPPGSHRAEEIRWPKFAPVKRIQVEVFRPTGYSVGEARWQGAPDLGSH